MRMLLIFHLYLSILVDIFINLYFYLFMSVYILISIYIYIYIQLSIAFQRIEMDRVSALQVCLKTLCQNERSNLRYRNECLDEFERVIDKLQPLNDVNEFIRREKTPELTHRYAHALNMMDLLAMEINRSGSRGGDGDDGDGDGDDDKGGVCKDGNDDDTLNDSFEDSEEVGR